jgi:hypothetical protein
MIKIELPVQMVVMNAAVLPQSLVLSIGLLSLARPAMEGGSAPPLAFGAGWRQRY